MVSALGICPMQIKFIMTVLARWILSDGDEDVYELK
jgi:hypothetical protein